MVLSRFESLSVRPPTPPKDVEEANKDIDIDIDETLQFLEDPFGDKPVQPRAVARVTAKKPLNTPDQSPSSDISIPDSSASKKRVNFEVLTHRRNGNTPTRRRRCSRTSVQDVPRDARINREAVGSRGATF